MYYEIKVLTKNNETMFALFSFLKVSLAGLIRTKTYICQYLVSDLYQI